MKVSSASSLAAATSAPGPPGSTKGVDALGRSRASGDGAQDEPALGSHRGTAGRGEGDAVAAGSPERGGSPPGAGEDLVRAHGVERLEPFEGDDHDVALVHAPTVRGAGVWRQ